MRDRPIQPHGTLIDHIRVASLMLINMTNQGMTFVLLTLAACLACGSADLIKPAPPTCNTTTCTQLEQQYEKLKNETCAEVAKQVPALDAADVAEFMKLYQNFTGGTPAQEAPLFEAAAKILDTDSVQKFLSLPDSFDGGLDALMVKCAVLVDATPTGLALFAQAGTTEQGLVTQLLGDSILMRDMLVAGGAASSEEDKGSDETGAAYGQAMAIYSKIKQASHFVESSAPADPYWDDRSQGNILKRAALGTALMHAVPIHHKYAETDCDEAYDWCPPGENNTEVFVDPVARYLHYEQAYHAGDLDPAFEVLTAWECRHTTNSPAWNEDLEWFRKTLAMYRPDHIATDYNWRYARAVRTEVSYGDPQCATLPGICDGHYAQIPAANGVCGPRAFFGRFNRLAFGLPVWGATQPGHAAMTTWTPTGWDVLLGAGWPFCWWGQQGGPDWVLQAEARENRTVFQKVLRGTWWVNS